MNDTNDDLYVPMMTETYDEKESFSSKAGTFCKKFLLFIITVALLLFLILQFILISGGKSIKDEWEAHKAAVEAAEAAEAAAAEAAAAAEVVDVTPVVDDTTADVTQVDETTADETQVDETAAADDTAADETAAETETETQTDVVIDSSTQGDSEIAATA